MTWFERQHGYWAWVWVRTILIIVVLLAFVEWLSRGHA